MKPRAGHFKDEILNTLARRWNIAQFVSFGPDLRQRFAWIQGHEPNRHFRDPPAAVRALLDAAPEGSVNVRSFHPDNPKSREFLYGLRGVDRVVRHLQRLARQGLYTIVNETIDVKDGGVSGVAFGRAVEFAPEDTPRAVEKPGTAALPRDLARKLFTVVYGVDPAVPRDPHLRVEFSIHPIRRGTRGDHTIIWEIERAPASPPRPTPRWPNRFSRFIGDKAFGLLMAHLAGFPVPRTTVISRKTAPFTFGRPTGSAEPWIRTAPMEQVPGRFTTLRGWLDPFRLLRKEDPTGRKIASVLAQVGVAARFSGALAVEASGRVKIEGVSHFGDEFMVGRRSKERLPRSVTRAVLRANQAMTRYFGPVRFEWVYDGTRVWVVQLHVGVTASFGRTIYPGKPRRFHRFRTDRGIEALRHLIDRVDGRREGILLVGRVGITSHFGDLLRRAHIPSRIMEPAR